MPLVRKPPSTAPTPAAPSHDTAEVSAALASGNADERFAAAAAADIPESVPALGAALASETSAAVREALFSALARIGSPASVEAVLPYLRSDDALLRTEAADALAAMREAGWPSIAALLRDTDADIRIVGCTLVRNLPTETAATLCCELLEQEQHPNVCAAAVDVLAELGHAPALPVLARCAERFRGTPFLEFAIRTAIDRVRSHAPNSRA